jgi:hypothetical protein
MSEVTISTLFLIGGLTWMPRFSRTKFDRAFYVLLMSAGDDDDLPGKTAAIYAAPAIVEGWRGMRIRSTARLASSAVPDCWNTTFCHDYSK